ncbi:MAG: FAD-dependent monooxygenase [Gammaproteobacteria bacterium]|nr:FAD-dependent monooxygenase [Gammaproteobacteria bacterium]MCP5195400.1 FAD-dependent monooxygenase [Gammaproteobacteria bacterium]
MQTDVLIVGAGPTGLALATILKRAGIDCVIVDRLKAGQHTSRAAVLHAHTLEILEALGVSERLSEEGLKLTHFRIRDRDQILVRLRFDRLPTRFAHLLMLPQDRTEAILTDALIAAGGTVRRGHTVETLLESLDDVTAIVTSDGRRETIHARYVVGADGMHSLVRRSAGISFEGTRYEESFVLADVAMSWALGREEVSLFFSPAGLVVVAPLPIPDRYRIVATLEDAPEHPGKADVQALLDTRGPKCGAAKVIDVLWSSRFRLHHRVANQYRRGRFLLVGDAAHVHSPAGGQGMNTGLVDAYVLGHLLADVVSGRRDDSHLDRYEALRRPAAQQVLRLAGRLTRLATVRSVLGRTLRNLALQMVDRLSMARHQFEMNLSGLSRRAAAALESDCPQSTRVIEASDREVGTQSVA